MKNYNSTKNILVRHKQTSVQLRSYILMATKLMILDIISVLRNNGKKIRENMLTIICCRKSPSVLSKSTVTVRNNLICSTENNLSLQNASQENREYRRKKKKARRERVNPRQSLRIFMDGTKLLGRFSSNTYSTKLTTRASLLHMVFSLSSLFFLSKITQGIDININLCSLPHLRKISN